MASCAATRRDGQPCRTQALPGDRYCFAHSEATASKRRAAHARGGRNKSSAARAARLVPEVLKPVLFTLLKGLSDVSAGRMDPRTGGALASLAGAIVRVYEAGLLEERVRELEDQRGRAG